MTVVSNRPAIVVTNEEMIRRKCLFVSIAPYGSYVGLKFPHPDAAVLARPGNWQDPRSLRLSQFVLWVAVCASGHIQVGLIGRCSFDEGLKYRL